MCPRWWRATMGPARSAGLPSLRQARAPPAMMGGWAALAPSGATRPSGDVDGRKARAPWPLTSGIPVLPSPPPRQLLRSALCGHRHLHEGAAVPEFGRLASGRCRRGRSRVSLRSGNECALGGSHGAAGGARCLHRLRRWTAAPLRPVLDEMFLDEGQIIVDCGDVDVGPCGSDQAFRNLEAAVRKVLDLGAVPVVIGGDHATPIPSPSSVRWTASVTCAWCRWTLTWIGRTVTVNFGRVTARPCGGPRR